MIGQQGKRRAAISAQAPLTLSTVDGTPLYTFPGSTIGGFRRMFTGLSWRDSLPSRIAVVAAHHGEGTTFTTLALATTLASDMAASVCAVELNWWSPGMQHLLADPIPPRKRRFGRKQPAPVLTPRIEAGPGLAGVLAGTAMLEEVLIQTDRPNLQVLPAGEMPEGLRPSTARSSTLVECIERLSQSFDYLIMDIPPILVTSDAIALASLAEACCVVVQQGVTPANNTKLALDEIKHLPMLGVILNQVQIKTPGWIHAFLPQE